MIGIAPSSPEDTGNDTHSDSKSCFRTKILASCQKYRHQLNDSVGMFVMVCFTFEVQNDLENRAGLK